MLRTSTLAAAALLTLYSGAQAADLNHPASPAIDYVKVCDAYGAGFFYIPGSDTCLKIGGYIFANYETGTSNTVRGVSGTGATRIGTAYGGPFAPDQRNVNSGSSFIRAGQSFDARTNTTYGLLRSFISYNVNMGTSAGNSAVTTVRLDGAYIQFAGLTAGRAPTAFGFYASDLFDVNFGQVSDAVNTNLIAYTAAFGNGVTATLSLEDPTTSNNFTTSSNNNAASFRRNGFTFNYGALNAPDVVANIDVTQAWGEARLGAVAHQVYGSTLSPATKWGYAVEGTVLLNVPQLGTGDQIGLTAAYGEGANSYVNGGGQYPGAFNLGSGVSDLGMDATYSTVAGLKLTRSWSVFSAITHNISPNFEVNAGVGFQSVSNSGSGVNGTASVPAGAVASGQNRFSFGQTEAALQVKWKPAKGIFIGPYVEFRNVSFSSATVTNYNLATKNATAADFGVRIRRDF